MNDIKISVIVTTYNIEKYIGECIESVQKQNYDDIEIICVDDCSTDGTIDLIKQYQENDDRIILLKHEENGGPARARNTGCRQAKGKYIYFLDGDDYLKEGMFDKLYRVSEENDLDVLSFSGEAFVDDEFADGNRYSSKKDIYKRKKIYNGVFSGSELFAEYMMNADNSGNLYLQFIKRDFYIGNNLYALDDLRYDNDSPFGIYMRAKRVMCIPDIFYMRRYRPESRVTGGKSFEKAECIALRLFTELMLWQSLDLSDRVNEGIKLFFLNTQRSLCFMLQGVDEEEKKYKILLKYPVARYFMEYFIINRKLYPGLTEEAIEKLKNCENIVLYGAGSVAKEVGRILIENGVDFFPMVTKRECGQLFLNRKVIEPDEEDIEWNNTIVVLGVSEMYYDQIINNLKKKRPKEIIKVI